ncbi:phage holin family protein [Arthrobacter sp. B0490]|uniref:phage holin family protein n=1 Tax=Arthrobacter sp. B0490 TaxID=2058891 RepID=UPI0015E2D637|nr:phage holin family protein [Arthrobacter sp. B0490]
MVRLLRALILQWLVLVVVLAITALLVPGVQVTGGLWGLIVTAAVVGLVNALVGPVLRLLALPLTLLTLGLFSLVVNAVLLWLSAVLSGSLQLGGPLTTILAAFVISVLNAVGTRLVLPRRTDDRTSRRHG